MSDDAEPNASYSRDLQLARGLCQELDTLSLTLQGKDLEDNLQSDLLNQVRKANFDPLTISKWEKDLIQGIAICNLEERRSLGRIGPELLQLAGLVPSSFNEAHGPKVHVTLSSPKSTKRPAHIYLTGLSRNKDHSSPIINAANKDSIEDNQLVPLDTLDASFDSPEVNFNLGQNDTIDSRSQDIGLRSWKRDARRTKLMQRALSTETGESSYGGQDFQRAKEVGPLMLPQLP